MLLKSPDGLRSERDPHALWAAGALQARVQHDGRLAALNAQAADGGDARRYRVALRGGQVSALPLLLPPQTPGVTKKVLSKALVNAFRINCLMSQRPRVFLTALLEGCLAKAPTIWCWLKAFRSLI